MSPEQPILLIDCGNSHTKIGIAVDGVLSSSHSIDNKQFLNKNAAPFMQHFLQSISVWPQRVVLASVVPKLQKILCDILTDLTEAEINIINDTSFPDMQIDTDIPSEVGADRLVNAYAACQLFGTRQIVIDFGTATTFDVVDSAGNYAGGLILPGLELSLQTLHKATAQLPLVHITPASKVLAKNTVDAINQGIYWGYIAILDGLIDRLDRENGYQSHVIATGGYADLWQQDCRSINIIDKDLTLKGLLRLAGNHKK